MNLFRCASYNDHEPRFVLAHSRIQAMGYYELWYGLKCYTCMRMRNTLKQQ